MSDTSSRIHWYTWYSPFGSIFNGLYTALSWSKRWHITEWCGIRESNNNGPRWNPLQRAVWLSAYHVKFGLSIGYAKWFGICITNQGVINRSGRVVTRTYTCAANFSWLMRDTHVPITVLGWHLDHSERVTERITVPVSIAIGWIKVNRTENWNPESWTDCGRGRNAHWQFILESATTADC